MNRKDEGMTITEFLLARIAEDERHARKLAETDRRPVLALAITANHPQRVLAECEAKRRIVERAGFLIDEPDGLGNLCEGILTDLAAIYADHPDYREEWRVS